METYHINNAQRSQSWLGREAVQIIKALTAAGQEICENIKGLFDTLSGKFKPQHNEAILYLKYCKIIQNADENAVKGWEN